MYFKVRNMKNPPKQAAAIGNPNSETSITISSMPLFIQITVWIYNYMDNLYRKWITFAIMIVFFWSWPVRLVTKKSNCYFWTLENLIVNGGRAQWYPSKRWIGYHVVWIDNDGQKFEYTIPRMKRDTPWYKMLFYDGKVRPFRELNKDQ